MKLGIDSVKLPEAKKRGPLASLDHVKELGLAGIFFSTALDMSPDLDSGLLREIRAKADDLGLYLESGIGKINPYCSAEEPALRAAGGGDIIAGFTRMIEASAAIGCHELWVAPGNFKGEYRGRLANDRFRTDVTWEEQLLGIEKVLRKLAPVARANGAHMNIETHDEITSFEILRLIEKVGADCVGVVFDTANGLQRGEHPVFAAKRLAPYIRQTHIKDAYVGRAPGGLDFQTRPVGGGIVDFAAILPILAEANPRLNLSLEVAQSVADKPRKANPRQCIEIDNPIWRAGHPDLTADELAAYMAMVDAYEKRVASGAVLDWEAYESSRYGYPTYEVQSYGFDEAIGFIRQSARHIEAVCAEKDIALSVPEKKQKAA
ncbi:sugar phosphate isomerase/epimerase [Rhizobium leguminosarum]|uniref:sugar phosphate isomerase/epimerase family protein n=1 Tax=Rhizobium leguminosarum TaxID=384 RepID=UPI001A935C31|nr:sugar phosphate isomerase/epimerase family protein [Rhizobium leguminosarum]MBY5554496.1 sugar phosphate isomerase/epimerase [Rhizobium leguminosarum]MBY5636502.1 sugar phosphate isomerase/epimerase [Rhizobium leguminosarum]MBY5689853.1 sugar phosphate isomerase/epimerase [Rhizobium leguminosarum]MBY5722129.1 sugar phosphate isomerase/epimerase [Rhizobium leguminosarum]MBY5746003.1 sugar phosphate isomerase/epimerase [Rhizobium leguminosarum]